MKHLRILFLAMFALLAFGAVATATASAEEKEPAGLLPLPGLKLEPVKLLAETQEVHTELKDKTGALLTVLCTKVRAAGTAGPVVSEHITLGELEVEFAGCKKEKVNCSTENPKGEKDGAGIILLAAKDTDIHSISEEEGGKLKPAFLAGLLELEEGGKKLDLTLNCAMVKILVLGAQLLEIKGKNLGTEDAKEVEIITPNGLTPTCDKNDKLCTEELEKWGSKKCPLSGTLGAEPELCVEFLILTPVKVKLTPDVLIDF